MTETVWTTAAIARELEVRAPGDSIRIPKSQMARIPDEFEPTVLGTPLWMAHPGSYSQYRASPALHAYEMEGSWEIHRDRFDPKDNPVGHFLLDAPELPLATAVAGLVGVLTYWLLDGWDARKTEADGRTRSPWVRGAIAAGVALAAWILAYVIFALVRIHFGVA